MNSSAVAETVALVQQIGAALLNAGQTTDADFAADLRLAVGNLVDRAEVLIRARGMGTALQTAFTAAVEAEATFEALDRIRRLALAISVSTLTGQAAKTACVRFCLIAMAQVLAQISFRSRDDATAAAARASAAFSPAIEDAADAGDQQAYRDLVALHAAVTRDLGQRARPLPRMVSFSLPRSLPTLVISQRIYSAGDRADEIAAENAVIHPLFAPAQGRALSA